MDDKALRKKMDEYNAMILYTVRGNLIFVSPKEVPEDFKSEVVKSFPEVTVEFITSVKPTTENMILEIMQSSGTTMSEKTFKRVGKKLTITLETEDTLGTNAVIKALKNVIENDGFIEVLKFNVGGKETTYNLGKPLIINHVRIEPITKADIMDLSIVLETCKDVNQLLEVI